MSIVKFIGRPYEMPLRDSKRTDPMCMREWIQLQMRKQIAAKMSLVRRTLKEIFRRVRNVEVKGGRIEPNLISTHFPLL